MITTDQDLLVDERQEMQRQITWFASSPKAQALKTLDWLNCAYDQQSRSCLNITAVTFSITLSFVPYLAVIQNYPKSIMLTVISSGTTCDKHARASRQTALQDLEISKPIDLRGSGVLPNNTYMITALFDMTAPKTNEIFTRDT